MDSESIDAGSIPARGTKPTKGVLVLYIVVGLGNPGVKYEETRHNVGFKTIDILSGQENIDVSKKKFKAFIGEGNLGGEKIALLKPQTYMNLSGECVQAAIGWYKIPLSNLIIVYDDVDLPVGKIRIKARGSAGTHNGMRSIVDYVETEDFPRVRIGIGAPKVKEFELADYVLSRFASEEKLGIESGFKNAVEAVKIIIQSGIDVAMNKFN